MARRVQVPPSSGADLAALLATEQRLEQALAVARVEADRVRDEARARAAEVERAAEATLSAAVTTMEAEVARDTATQLATLEAEADRDVSAWNALVGPRLDRAVVAVLAALRARLEEPS